MNVSVIIPAFNAAETIAQTLESLLAQTDADWEAVVVDDGSIDATGVIAEGFARHDPRIRVVRQPNAGEAAARNTGIAAARHDWLLFLDADDWIDPKYLKRMTGELAANPGLDAVHCGYARIAADGTPVIEKYLPPAGDMFTTWARRSAFPVHACIVRKRLVQAVGGFDPSLQKSPDWDLWQRVARTGAHFGAVRDVLALYRMRPHAASLDAAQMLRDGLRVLRQGHAPDPRVPNPLPEHARGAPPDQVPTQVFYLLSWCAGLMLGGGQDARPLLDQVRDVRFPELYPEAVAQTLFDAAPLPGCGPPASWEQLWPTIRVRVEGFLAAVEAQAQAPGLALRARDALVRMILRHAPSWQPAVHELEQEKAALEQEKATLEREKAALEQEKAALEEEKATVDAERGHWERLALVRERDGNAQREQIGRLERSKGSLEAQIQELEAARAALFNARERRLGDLLLNRLRLGRPLGGALALARAIGQRLVVARLALERRLSGRKPRVLTTVCWNFPIYSQTFVYQELTQLLGQGLALRLIYSKLDPREQLPVQFSALWSLRRRLFLNRRTHERDYAHYRHRMPERIETLIRKLCAASGLSREALVTQGNFLEAFSFTRMVEAYRTDYLHSYFFYDRSLMALVAGYLLEIPRGVTCYADHQLKDYELKVVPLHLELASVVVATSERIRRELLELAPETDPDRILVKPNGISTVAFPVLEHAEPADGQPFRLVAVCRIEPKKGLLDLIEAVALLRERGHRVEAHLVGAPDEWNSASVEYKRRLDQRIGELGLWGTVHLEGRQDPGGVKRLLGLSHLFVAPFVETETGDKDGIPTALLEGMATGLPAVATDAGSITEVLINGQNGLLVPQRNPAALADAIELLLRDPERRRQLGGQAAGTIRRRFDVASCERVFHERLRGLLATGAGRRGAQG